MIKKSSPLAYAIEPWQSRTDAVLAVRDKWFSPVLAALLAMVAGIVLLTPFLTFDRIVSSTDGKIVATGQLINLQALDPSIIRSIDVKEGEEVAAGQRIATLDSTFAVADVTQLQRQLTGLDAQIDRVRAEQAHQPYAPAVSTAGPTAPYVALQRQLFSLRSADLQSQVRSFDEKVKANDAAIVRIEAERARLQEREKIANQIEGMRTALFNSGSSSLLNKLEAVDSHLEMKRTLESDSNSLTELQSQSRGLQSDRAAAIQQWYSTGSQELVDAENEKAETAASLEKAAKRQDLVELVASEPAVVLTLTKLSTGSILKEGDPVVTLVPLRSPVEAQIHFSSKDIGFVRPGDQASIKVDAFNSFEHGTAEGRVSWISEGAFTTDANGKPVDAYYKARISIDTMQFVNVPDEFRLIPGMSLAVDIRAGHRSLFSLLFGAAVRGLGEALREP